METDRTHFLLIIEDLLKYFYNNCDTMGAFRFICDHIRFVVWLCIPIPQYSFSLPIVF